MIWIPLQEHSSKAWRKPQHLENVASPALRMIIRCNQQGSQHLWVILFS